MSDTEIRDWLNEVIPTPVDGGLAAPKPELEPADEDYDSPMEDWLREEYCGDSE